jgi:hypothetical protein
MIMPMTTSTKEDLLDAAREAQAAIDTLTQAMSDYQAACKVAVATATEFDGKNRLSSAGGTTRRLDRHSPAAFANDCAAYLYGSLERRGLPAPTVRNPEALPPCVDLVAAINTRIAD